MSAEPSQKTSKVERNADSTLDAGSLKPSERPQRAQTGACLVVFEGTTSRVVSLPAHGEIVVGRADICQIVLPHDGVSRKHARLWIDEGHATIADLGSQNGTRVN